MNYKEYRVLNSKGRVLSTFWLSDAGEVECVSSKDIDKVFSNLVWDTLYIEETGENTDDNDDDCQKAV